LKIIFPQRFVGYLSCARLYVKFQRYEKEWAQFLSLCFSQPVKQESDTQLARNNGIHHGPMLEAEDSGNRGQGFIQPGAPIFGKLHEEGGTRWYMNGKKKEAEDTGCAWQLISTLFLLDSKGMRLRRKLV
jgi:hypothetical protein